MKQTGKDAVIWSLKQLSTSAILRSKSESLLGKTIRYAKAAHVILIQRIVSMLQLKPKKSSQSLRQRLPKSTKNTEKMPVEVINIKYPEKVYTSFFISQYFAFLLYVVWLSLKHYGKIFWSGTKGSG